MEDCSEPMDPTQAVIERVKVLRRKRRLTAQQLAERMTEAGVPWKAGVVTKLETGRRESINLAELLALAYVLDVALVHLIVSAELDKDALCAITPTQAVTADTARRWIRGQEPLPGQDPRDYHSEVPAWEWTGPQVLFERIGPVREITPKGSDTPIFEVEDGPEHVLATEGYADTKRMDDSPFWRRVPKWSTDKNGDIHIEKGDDGQH